MYAPNVQDTLEFVARLKLDVTTGKHYKLVLPDNEEAAVIDDGVCTSFTTNVTGQMKEDVMNSILLAQLSANTKYDRQAQVEEWYGEYRTVLKTIGWIVGEFILNDITDTDDYEDVAGLVLAIATDLLSPSEMPLLRKTVNSLKSSDNKGPNKLYNDSTKSAQAANFQVGQVSKNANGDPEFKITVHYFSASVEIVDVLFFSFESSSVKFRAGYQTLTLDSSFYSTVREAILEKLGNSVMDFIEKVQLE